MPFLDATVILFKCDKTDKTFGVRVEKTPKSDWVRTWAFPIDEKIEKKENYAAQEVSGTFTCTNEYEGCPYCQTYSFFKCGSCQKITCLSKEDNTTGNVVTCHWCQNKAALASPKKTLDISGNSF